MKKPEEPPRGLTGYIIRKCIPNYQDIQNEQVRSSYGYLEGWLSAVINLLLAALKLFLGFLIQSSSLIADAIHSLSDLLTSAVVIFGFKAAKMPRDQEHPYGHAKAELIASLIISVLLIVAGFELLQRNFLLLIKQDFSPIHADGLTLTLVSTTIILKEWLAYFSKKLGVIIDSLALEADAWHHRVDSITTALVVVGLLGSNWGILWLDNTVGLIVSLVVIWSGVEIGKDSISPLLGENVPLAVISRIQELALKGTEIHGVHDILVHRYGRRYYITLDAEFPIHLSLTQVHDLSAKISEQVTQEFPGECTVHIDPIDLKNPKYLRVKKVLEELIHAKQEIIEFHDLQFRDKQDHEMIQWEFSVDPKVEEKEYPQLKKEISFYLQRLLEKDDLFHRPQVKFSLEPGYNVIL